MEQGQYAARTSQIICEYISPGDVSVLLKHNVERMTELSVWESEVSQCCPVSWQGKQALRNNPETAAVTASSGFNGEPQDYGHLPSWRHLLIGQR